MFNFAHNGVEHATTNETISHASPAIIGLTILALVALVAIARLLSSKPDKEESEE